MGSRLALIGGGEFDPGFEDVHASLLKKTGVVTPKVIYFPTAAAKDGPGVAEHWASVAVTHFQQLGASAQAVKIFDRDSANSPRVVRLIQQADLIYLGGGLPHVYLEILHDTLALVTVIEAYKRGVWLVAASAGAMILGEACLVASDPSDYPPSTWSDGFALLPGVGIAPHFNTFPKQWIEKIKTTRPDTIFLMGIDEQTALVRTDEAWAVMGRGSITLNRGELQETYYTGVSMLRLALP